MRCLFVFDLVDLAELLRFGLEFFSLYFLLLLLCDLTDRQLHVGMRFRIVFNIQQSLLPNFSCFFFLFFLYFKCLNSSDFMQ